MAGQGRPPYVPTDEHRQAVIRMARAGVSQERIYKCLGISINTLRKYYLDELTTSHEIALDAVASALYQAASDPKHPQFATCSLFWMKTRGRWSEPKQELDVTSKDEKIGGFTMILNPTEKPDPEPE